MPEGRGDVQNIFAVSDSPHASRSRVRRKLTKAEFAKRLNDAMIMKGWWPAELARRAKLTRASVGTYLNGENAPTKRSLARLARALGIAEADLLPNVDASVIEAEVNPAPEIRASKSDPTRIWIKLNREVSSLTAAKIQQILAEEDVALSRRK